MELALSLGGDPSRPFSFLNKNNREKNSPLTNAGGVGGSTSAGNSSKCMGLGLGLWSRSQPEKVPENSKRNSSSEEEEEEEEERKSGGVGSRDGKDDAELEEEEEVEEEEDERRAAGSSSSDDHHQQPVQLDLLPFSPVLRPHQHQHQILPSPHFNLPWLHHLPNSNTVALSKTGPPRRPHPSWFPPHPVPPDDPLLTRAEDQTSPNSAASALMEFSLYRGGNGPIIINNNNNNHHVAAGPYVNNRNNNNNNKRPFSADGNNPQHLENSGSGGTDPTATSLRGNSDEDDNGSTRKKLRLSKEQSAYLEESFKENHTLNPKQKLALAKQLKLRPRQVEVWFQNRRARTKLKQTEVDCEYLKRCCETLTEENKRLHKELQELRALKSSQPFYMQLPATTLTMCPSCERVVTTTTGPPPNSNPNPNTAAKSATVAAATATAAVAVAVAGSTPTTALTLAKPMLPFAGMQAQQDQGHHQAQEDRA